MMLYRMATENFHCPMFGGQSMSIFRYVLHWGNTALDILVKE